VKLDQVTENVTSEAFLQTQNETDSTFRWTQ